jgi:hypothetical protein
MIFVTGAVGHVARWSETRRGLAMFGERYLLQLCFVIAELKKPAVIAGFAVA